MVFFKPKTDIKRKVSYVLNQDLECEPSIDLYLGRCFLIHSKVSNLCFDSFRDMQFQNSNRSNPKSLPC